MVSFFGNEAGAPQDFSGRISKWFLKVVKVLPLIPDILVLSPIGKRVIQRWRNGPASQVVALTGKNGFLQLDNTSSTVTC